MFARVKKSGKYQYLQIVENHKEGKKVLQLGRQLVNIKYEEAIVLAKKSNFQYRAPSFVNMSFNEEQRKKK